MRLKIFNDLYPEYKITKPVRLIELFAGIGSQAKALKRLGVNFEHYKVVEFDKYAINSYNAVHNTKFETSDITKINASDLQIVNTDQYEYIMTYSFPCQDLSLAGSQKGMSKGSGTRSGLLWEVERILDECEELPQILLMENVPQVVSSKNIIDFDTWRSKLTSLGYTNFLQILNSKDYGIPQTRNRCFMVSILGKYHYRFPRPFELTLRLKDMLEKNVDEKYYLSDKMKKYIISNNEKWTGNNDKSLVNKSIASTLNIGEGRRRCDASNYIAENLEEENIDLKKLIDNNYTVDEPGIKEIGFIKKSENGTQHQSNTVYSAEGIARTLTAVDYKSPLKIVEAIRIGGLFDNEKGKHQAGSVWDSDYLSPALDTMQGGYRQPCVIVPEETSYAVEPLICASRGRNPNNPSSRKSGEPLEQRIEVNKKGLANTLTTVHKDNLVLEHKIIVGSTQKNTAINFNGICPTLTEAMGKGGGHVPMHNYDLRIRKLTPRECWRLMGFDDTDYDSAAKVNSDTQLYKQAGNSIVVNVLYYIFKQLF